MHISSCQHDQASWLVVVLCFHLGSKGLIPPSSPFSHHFTIKCIGLLSKHLGLNRLAHLFGKKEKPAVQSSPGRRFSRRTIRFARFATDQLHVRSLQQTDPTRMVVPVFSGSTIGPVQFFLYFGSGVGRGRWRTCSMRRMQLPPPTSNVGGWTVEGLLNTEDTTSGVAMDGRGPAPRQLHCRARSII